MKPEVQEAVAELRACFPAAVVSADDDGSGGAFVTVDPIDPGPAYRQDRTRLKFHISHMYPDADVYPLFVRPDLRRVDGRGHGRGFAAGSFRNESALQLSRRSNNRTAEFDTAARKVLKVIEWMHAQ
ncbi:hypothetical protein [Candidatus Poriferisodalis sp.]|uniref:hypothetical protein n=1 Tax=Candidatus Poriferisodalis sp. TaxID=3101277 RepID=UPI003B01A068